MVHKSHCHYSAGDLTTVIHNHKTKVNTCATQNGFEQMGSRKLHTRLSFRAGWNLFLRSRFGFPEVRFDCSCGSPSPRAQRSKRKGPLVTSFSSPSFACNQWMSIGAKWFGAAPGQGLRGLLGRMTTVCLVDEGKPSNKSETGTALLEVWVKR